MLQSAGGEQQPVQAHTESGCVQYASCFRAFLFWSLLFERLKRCKRKSSRFVSDKYRVVASAITKARQEANAERKSATPQRRIDKSRMLCRLTGIIFFCHFLNLMPLVKRTTNFSAKLETQPFNALPLSSLPSYTHTDRSRRKANKKPKTCNIVFLLRTLKPP